MGIGGFHPDFKLVHFWHQTSYIYMQKTDVVSITKIMESEIMWLKTIEGGSNIRRTRVDIESLPEIMSSNTIRARQREDETLCLRFTDVWRLDGNIIILLNSLITLHEDKEGMVKFAIDGNPRDIVNSREAKSLL